MVQLMRYAIQAHVTFGEVAALATQLSMCAAARITLIPASGKPRVLSLNEEVKEAEILSSEPSWLAVTPGSPALARVSQAIDFVTKNGNYVLFTFLGNRAERVLMESFVEMSIGDVPSRKCWLGFKRNMLKILPTGAWIWSYDGASRRYDKNRRISVGARQLWADGGDLRLLNFNQVDPQEREATWKGYRS